MYLINEPIQGRHRLGYRRRPRLGRVAALFVAVIISLTAVTGAVVPLLPRPPAEAADLAVGAELAAATPVDPTIYRPAPDPLSSSARRLQRAGTRPRVPARGTGLFDIARAKNRGAPFGIRRTYSVEVEGGLPFRASAVAEVIEATLTDPRGWRDHGRRLLRVDTDPDIRVLLASPEMTDALCAPLRTRGRLSCRNGAHVVLNAWRWVHGAAVYRGDLANYRRYLVNHEVGHALGNSHAACPRSGAPAPVMLQQTLGLDGCRPNPWPTPPRP